MKEKKSGERGFLKGMIAGASAAAAGFAAAAVILHGGFGVVLAQQADSSTEESSSDTVVDDELLQKLQVLEYYVDQKYLMDEPDAEESKNEIYKAYMDSLGDPYSCYYTAEEYEALLESTSGTYCGIGVVVSKSLETGEITVSKVFSGCPGEEAGILPNDIITQVAGLDVSDMDLSTVVSYIKGEEGTRTTVQVYRPSEETYLDLEVERRQIDVPTVEYHMLEDNIGYVIVTEFDDVTADQYISAVDDLKSQGMEGMIVDLRDNPGGLLSTVVKMLDYMLPEGTIVYTKDKNGEGSTYTSDAENYFDLPLAVLVNGDSASASEIFAGAIKDYQTGIIVGTTTFGKGIVQQLYPFKDGTAIKLTVSRYYTPNGTCIHGVGVEPDAEVELDEELQTLVTIPEEEDNQLQAAISEVKTKMSETDD